MKHPFVLALALLLTLPALAQPVTVFRHANVIDGRGGPPLMDRMVVVENGLLAQIVAEGAAVPAGAVEIDLGGRYLLPGLIDAHVHIATLAGARRALESGVTTVRSASTTMYQDIALRELVRTGALPGPEVLAAGAFVTPDLGDRILADPRLATLYEGVESEAALRHLVRVNLDRGADVIKTRGTERAGLPDTDPRKQVYTEAQLRIIVDEAAKDGVPVLAHAHGDEGAAAAVRAGVRSIEHGTYLSPETLGLMKDRGTYLVPTYTTVVDLVEPGGEYDDPVLQIRGRHMRPRLAETIRRAHAMGVPLVASTDSGYGPESLTRVPQEVANFVALGLGPAEALATATTTAAALLQIADRTGVLAEGFEADLIVVEQNPLDDIAALQDVLVVMSNGHLALNRLPFGKK